MLKAGGWPAVFSRLARLAFCEKLEEGKELTWRGPGEGCFRQKEQPELRPQCNRVRNGKGTVRGRMVGNEVRKVTSWDREVE